MEKALELKNYAHYDLRAVVYQLDQLAKAFETTGNQVVADKLHELGNEVYSATNSFDEAFGILFDNTVNQAHQATLNMLGAALVAATSIKESNP